MNLPNSITIGRLFLAVIYVVAASLDGSLSALVAWLSFILAAATDWLDGYLARKLNLVTALGKLLDPLVDKILVCAAFLHLSVVSLCPMWVTATIVAREFLVTGLRQIAVERGVVIAADRMGKWKTIMQITYVITGLTWLYLSGLADLPMPIAWLRSLANPQGTFFSSTLYLSLILTLLSGINYLIAARYLLRDDR